MWTDAPSHGAGYSPAPPGTTGDLPPPPHSSPEAQAVLPHIPDLNSLGMMVLKEGSLDGQHQLHLRTREKCKLLDLQFQELMGWDPAICI